MNKSLKLSRKVKLVLLVFAAVVSFSASEAHAQIGLPRIPILKPVVQFLKKLDIRSPIIINNEQNNRTTPAPRVCPVTPKPRRRG